MLIVLQRKNRSKSFSESLNEYTFKKEVKKQHIELSIFGCEQIKTHRISNVNGLSQNNITFYS